jgi:hypothetical protein
MKISELKLIIKEEIADLFNSDAPKAKYKKGDKLNYRGTPYTVVSDSGYVVTVVDDKGKETTYNHNQLRQGVYKKPDYLNEAKMGITLYELPKFNELPDEGNDGNISITIPSLDVADGGVILYSKKAAEKWQNNFINKWGLKPGEEQVKFSPKIPYDVVNASDKYYKWKAGEIETKGAAYSRLGRYKGD